MAFIPVKKEDIWLPNIEIDTDGTPVSLRSKYRPKIETQKLTQYPTISF